MIVYLFDLLRKYSFFLPYEQTTTLFCHATNFWYLCSANNLVYFNGII